MISREKAGLLTVVYWFFSELMPALLWATNVDNLCCCRLAGSAGSMFTMLRLDSVRVSLSDSSGTELRWWRRGLLRLETELTDWLVRNAAISSLLLEVLNMHSSELCR